VIIWWEDLSGLWLEDLLLDCDFSVGRISPDCGERIYCKIIILWLEDLFGLWREDPRLSLFIGKTFRIAG
jgi:hypothetical protein